LARTSSRIPLSPVLAPGDDWVQRRHQRGIYFADKLHDSFDGALHLSGSWHELPYYVQHGEHQKHNQTVRVMLTLGPRRSVAVRDVVHGRRVGRASRSRSRRRKFCTPPR
jgi:hypothetical protein